MGKRSLWFAIGFCLCAYFGIFGISYYRYEIRRRAIKNNAQSEFDALTDKASAAAVLGFMEEPFLEAVRDIVDRSETIAAIIISGPEGPEYAYEKIAGYLDSDTSSPQFIFRPGISDTSYFSPLRYEGVRNATIRAIVYTISYNDIFIILRDAALMLIIPIVIAALSLLITPLSNTVTSDSKDPKSTAAETKAFVDGEDYTVEERESTAGTNIDPSDGFLPRINPAPEIDGTTNAPATAASADVNEAGPPPSSSSPLSGIGLDSERQTRLGAELHQAAMSEQDLAFLVIAPRKDTAAWASNFTRIVEKTMAFFPAHDLVYEWGEYGLAVILPDTDIDRAFEVAEEYLDRLHDDNGEAAALILSADPRIGLTARSGRLVDADRLSLEAAQALKKATREELSPLVAFKPDLARYRAYLAQENRNG